jgi:hypothetical protein
MFSPKISNNSWSKFWFEPRSPLPIALFRIIFCLFILETSIHFGCNFDLVYSIHAFPDARDVNVFQCAQFGAWSQNLPRLDLFMLFPEWSLWPHIMYGLQEAAIVSLIIGLFTRLSAFIVLCCLISVHTHNPLLMCASDRFEIIMTFLLCFSNAGDALSLDSLIKHRRDDWREVGFDFELKSGWVQRLMQVELAFVYFHTSISKAMDFQDWQYGTLMYYAPRWRELERLPAPAFLTDSQSGYMFMAYFALFIEFALWTLIWFKPLRNWIIVLGLIFHATIDWMMNLPNFEGLFMAALLNFVDADDIERWFAFLRKAAGSTFGRGKLIYDEKNLLYVRAAGVIHRLDFFHLLTLSAAGQTDGKAHSKVGLHILWQNHWYYFDWMGANPVVQKFVGDQEQIKLAPSFRWSQQKAIAVAAAGMCLIIALYYPWRKNAWQNYFQHDYDVESAKKQEAVLKEYQATNSLPLTDERRLLALEHFGDLMSQNGCRDVNKYIEAEKAYYDVWINREGLHKGVYDPQLVRVMLKMAALHRDGISDLGWLPKAEINYRSLLDYDRRMPHDNQSQDIARDWSNLGMACYLIGLSKPRAADGLPIYKQAIDCFEEAIKAYRLVYGPDSQGEGNCLANEAIAWREMGERQLAEQANKRAHYILSLIKRPDPLP